MRIVIFTSNAVRHKYLANTLSKKADDALVVSECKTGDAIGAKELPPSILEHFNLRYQAEKKFFADSDFFAAKTLPVLMGEASSAYVYDTIKRFKPDLMFVFGASIIREPLISMLPAGRFINLHLGLSPYYRGSGTNFWPFVNKELEYVGSTILHLDAGVDTGDIITHVRPKIEEGDDVHTVGCKVIKESVPVLAEIMGMVKNGRPLNRVKQWKVPDSRYYRNKDFNENVLTRYKDNMAKGLVREYLQSPKKELELTALHGR